MKIIVDEIVKQIEARHPGVKITIDAPKDPGEKRASWFLDIRIGLHIFVVEVINTGAILLNRMVTQGETYGRKDIVHIDLVDHVTSQLDNWIVGE